MSARSAGRAGEMVEFLGAVWALYRHLDAASSRMSENFGVSGPQRLALRLIEVNPGITAGQLAEALDLHRSTVSGLVKGFEARGLLRRRNDSADRRVVTLELTPAGRRLTSRSFKTIEATLQELIDAHGVEWRKRTRETLQVLSAAIGGAGRGRRGRLAGRLRDPDRQAGRSRPAPRS